MATLSEFRSQYPQYNDMSDQKLADSLYNKFYSDMPRADFDKKLGVNYSENLFQPKMQTATSALQTAGSETSKNPTAREIAKTELMTLIPPVRAFGPIGNALGNIAAGTAATTALEVPTSMDELQKSGLKNLGLNTLLQGIFSAGHIPAKIAEFINPAKYTGKLAGQAQAGYQAGRSAQKAAYKEVTDPYGEFMVTVDPKKYIGFDEDTMQYLTPNIKKEYNSFLREPNFNNLHDLQVQMGRDAAKPSVKNNENQFQAISNAHKDVKNKILSFLGRDENALNAYNRGTAITRDIVKPYEANKTLRGVSKGLVTDISPKQYANAILKGTQKEYGKIPEGHPLNAMLEDLQGKIQRGEALRQLSPEYLRKMVPNIAYEAQNPYVAKNLFGNVINPLFFGLGREAISNIPNG